MSLELVAQEISEVVRKALEEGRSEKIIDEPLWEEVSSDLDEIAGEIIAKGVPRSIAEAEAWKKIVRDVASDIRVVLEKAGLDCELLYRKEDVPVPEFLASCRSRDGTPVTLYLDVIYDPETDELVLNYVEAVRGRPPTDVLPFYTWI